MAELFAELKLKKLPAESQIPDLAKALGISHAEAESLYWSVKQRWQIEAAAVEKPSEAEHALSIAVASFIALAVVAAATIMILSMFTKPARPAPEAAPSAVHQTVKPRP
ncbi:MAG: hypothetical protein JSS72_09175 [Armatimonadetes bacterium]|nr:hypothetical protein [Armatimonadota bacterium]